MAKTYNKKSKEDKEKEVNELLEKANIGIENCFTTSEQFKELASYMSRFYNYSFRNTFLIQDQFEGALAVGSYAFWKEKGFTVNKGEKGIKILVPNRLSDYFINEKGEEVKLSKATPKEKRLIEQGEIELRKGKLLFNQGYVFDVSQTNAKAEDLPKIFPNRWLDGEVKNYDLMYKAMENIAKKIGVNIIEPKEELGAVKGVSYPLTKEVALNPRNTQLQNVKTLIHELTHAKLHTIETRDDYSTNAKEFQAEMAAYVVCSYFGLDTSEYSFMYINSWTKDVELKDKEKLINEVRETVKEYIEVIEDTLITDKELFLSVEKENILEKKIEDKKLIDFLGKDTVIIKEISREELERKINENNSYVFLENNKELSSNNYVMATKEKDIYKDLYVRKDYKLENLIYIDDNKNLYMINESKDYDKSLHEVKEQEGMNTYDSNKLKEEFIKGLKPYGVEDIGVEEFFYYTFDERKINNEINARGFEDVKEEIISAYLYADSVSEEDKITYSDVVLRNKDIVKDSIIKLAENENISFSDLLNNEDLKYLINNEDWKLTDRQIEEMGFMAMKNNIGELMKDNYEDFIKALISIEKGIDDLDLLSKVYERYIEEDFNLLNNAIEKNIEFEKDIKQENILSMDNKNLKKTVEVIYSEVPSFVEGEKLTLKETIEKFKEEVENGSIDKAIEFTFSLNENIKYNEEFIIDKGTSVDLIEFIDEKIGDNFYLHELIDDYLKSNDLEFENKELILEKDKNIEKYKEIELE